MRLAARRAPSSATTTPCSGPNRRPRSVELRAAFREAVLRHHPDRSADDAHGHAPHRRSLNRAWAELRDPLRRLHYDHELERGRAPTLDWPLEADEAPSAGATSSRRRSSRSDAMAHPRVPQRPRLPDPDRRSSWPARRPSTPGSWRNHIDGEDWREHRERYWLRFAAAHYHDRGRTDDWLGALERLVELEGTYETLVRADLRQAYVSAQEYLRGTGFLRGVAVRYGIGSPQRAWVDRELRALLGEYRDERVRRGRPEDRAEAAELLLNYLEALEMPLAFADVRAAIMAHVRAGHAGRAAELLERAVEVPITEPARWFSIVQLLTEGGTAGPRLGAAGGDHPRRPPRGAEPPPPARRPGAPHRRRQRAPGARASRAPRTRRPRPPRPARAPAPRPRRGPWPRRRPATISSSSGRIRSTAAAWASAVPTASMRPR